MEKGLIMGFKVGVGKSDFRDMREAGNYYVDKTEMLYELVHDTDNAVSLFTRPRRFGKTLMMSMMENFFNIRKDSKEIFDGLDIMEHSEFCDKWMNKYPVLFISFKDAGADEYSVAYDKLCSTVADVCKNYSDVMNNEKINPADLQMFEKLMFRNASSA